MLYVTAKIGVLRDFLYEPYITVQPKIRRTKNSSFEVTAFRLQQQLCARAVSIKLEGLVKIPNSSLLRITNFGSSLQKLLKDFFSYMKFWVNSEDMIKVQVAQFSVTLKPNFQSLLIILRKICAALVTNFAFDIVAPKPFMLLVELKCEHKIGWRQAITLRDQLFNHHYFCEHISH